MSLLSKTTALFRRSKQAQAGTKKTRTGKAVKTKTAAAKTEAAKPAAAAGALAARIGLMPLMTEKGMKVQAQHQTAIFQVRRGATKHEIARAIFEQYQVKPLAVRTVRMRGKWRRRGQTVGSTSDWKKAYVSVENVQKLQATP